MAETYLDINWKVITKEGTAENLTRGDPDSIRSHHSPEGLECSCNTVSIQMGYFDLSYLSGWVLGVQLLW